MKIIEFKEVSKSYGDLKAIEGISFGISEGELLGILGPVGSGKSTIINLMAGLVKESGGSIEIFEKDTQAKEVKSIVGLVPQELSFYDKLTLKENVQFFAGLYGISTEKLERYSMDALNRVQLLERKNSYPSGLSIGMKRRLNIACALAHSPKIVIMDEPASGLDDQSKNQIFEIIRELKDGGTTVVYTSHSSKDIETIEGKTALIDNGKIVAMGRCSELKEEYSSQDRFRIEIKEHMEFDINVFKRVRGVTEVSVINNTVEVAMEKDDDNMGNIMLFLVDKNIRVNSMQRIVIDLDNVFYNITGKSLNS